MQFVASRPNTPLLLRNKHESKMSQDLDLNGSPRSPRSPRSKENGTISVPQPNGVPKSGVDAVSVLEAKANGI
jgi:2-isopropylmalate synthase